MPRIMAQATSLINFVNILGSFWNDPHLNLSIWYMSFRRSRVADMPLTCLIHFGMNSHLNDFFSPYNILPHCGMMTCHICCVRIIDQYFIANIHVLARFQNWSFCSLCNDAKSVQDSFPKCKWIVKVRHHSSTQVNTRQILFTSAGVSLFLTPLSPAQLPFF